MVLVVFWSVFPVKMRPVAKLWSGGGSAAASANATKADLVRAETVISVEQEHRPLLNKCFC